MTLAELWSWGFEHGGRRYPWGTLASELPERDLRGGEVHGWPTIGRGTLAGHPRRPVSGVVIQIAAEANLHLDPRLDALRARLDADLGPGEHSWVERGPTKAYSRWTLGGVVVELDTYPAAWGFSWGRSTGRIVVQGDRERLAAPFLPEFGSLAAPAEFEVVAAPGLQGPPQDDIGLCLSRPELRATPPSLRLGPDEVAVWRQGLATATVALPSPPPLRHIRNAPARGSGFATLDLGIHRELLSTAPGEDGLDDVVARLRELGVAIETFEERDWG